MRCAQHLLLRTKLYWKPIAAECAPRRHNEQRLNKDTIVTAVT